MQENYITPFAIVNGEDKGYVSEASIITTDGKMSIQVVLADPSEGITDVLQFTPKTVFKNTCRFCSPESDLLSSIQWTISMLNSLSTDDDVKVKIKYTSRSVKFTFVNGHFGGTEMYFKY